MRARKSWLVLAGLLFAALIPSGSSVVAQESGHGTDEMMEAWIKIAAPGEHHKHLAKLAGTWKAEATIWMVPDAEPMKTVGTMKNQMVLDGRYLKSEYAGEMMGSPFHGVGIDGYDNVANKHTSMWMDTMSTTIMSLEGSCEQGGKVQVMHSEMTDPMTGETVKIKAVTTVHGPDKFTYESWETRPGAEPRKQMEILFTKS